MKHIMDRKILASVFALVSSVSANAADIEWTLQNVVFADDGAATVCLVGSYATERY